MEPKAANMKQRAWARGIILAVDCGKLVVEATRPKPDAIKFDEFLRLFKSGQLKLRPKPLPGDYSCDCEVNMKTALYRVFQVGHPHGVTDEERSTKLRAEFKALKDSALQRVSLASVTAGELDEITKSVLEWRP